MNALHAGTRWRALLALLRPLPLLIFVAWALAPRKRRGAARRRTSFDERSSRSSRRCISKRRNPTCTGSTNPTARWPLAPGSDRAPSSVHTAPGEAWDVFLVRTRLSPEGTPRRRRRLESHAHLGRERGPSRRARRTRRVAHRATHDAHVSRRARRSARRTAAAPARTGMPSRRAQRALTNLQRTGQLHGVLRRSFKLDPAAQRRA